MFMKNVVLHRRELPDPDTFSAFGAFENILIQVFAATDDLEHLQNVLSTLKHMLPQSTVIGCSSDGTIDRGKIHPYSDTIQLSITGFEHTAFSITSCTDFKDAFELGRIIAARLADKKTRLLISFSEAASVNGERYLEGIEREANGLKVSGGVASTPTFTDTFVIADEKILHSGAVAVALRGDALHFYTGFIFGWEPIGRKMTVTNVEGNLIRAIDNQPPLRLFRYYLGDEVADALPGTGSAFPLLLKRDGHYIARGIIGLNGESFIVSGNVKDEDEVYIGYGNPSIVVGKNTITSQMQDNFPAAEAIFNYYCEGRHLFLPDHTVQIEAEQLEHNGVSAGCFTLGEFYSHRSNALLNFSSTVLALAEKTSGNHQHTRHPSHELSADEKLTAMVTKGLFHLLDVRTQELQHQTYHDALTALPNRNFFNEMLALELEKAKKADTKVALLFLDLDNFKDVNDTLGHGSGDHLLQIIARRIDKVTTPDDLLSRWSGDEFVIMHTDCDSVDQLTDLATAILDIFKEPINIDDHDFTLGISIGISLYPNDGKDAETLVKHADAAMYAVKSGSKNNFSFYRKEMTEQALQRIALENDLRSAMKTGAFFLVYQPQVDMQNGHIIGVEALLRWKHPEHGIIMPDNFIGVTERTGLILPIGEMVMDMALGQFRAWQDAHLPIERISVNVSAKQFIFDDITALVTKYIDKHALSPKNVEIELTESTLMKYSNATLRTLEELHNLGVSISIDDFGTGYSSLSYLKRFKIDNIKIDKSFVEQLPDSVNDKAIVKAIIAIARALGLDIIVEGIENSRQKAFFASEGHMFAQGFFYSKPLTSDELVTLLER